MATPTTPVNTGGYDYEFVDPVPDECTCPICILVQRDAHQVTCCGKIYCKSCLEELKKKANKFECPQCRSSLDGRYKFFPDKNTISKIKHIRIRCTNKERGCQWVGHLKDLDTVHLPKCPNEIIECTNEKKENFFSRKIEILPKTTKKKAVGGVCHAKMQRCDMRVHMTEQCQWRRVKCPHCNEIGYHNEITGQHLEECHYLELPCGNNGCPTKIKRRLMTQHHDECPKQIIACQYSFAGCEKRFTRESTQDHNKVFIQYHLDTAMIHLNKTKTLLTGTRTRLAATERQLNATETRLTATETRLEEALSYIQPSRESSTVIKVPYVPYGEFISPGFYVNKGGYQFGLKVTERFANGANIAISVMSGKCDDVLEWPFTATVTIHLLNQNENKNHLLVVNKDQAVIKKKVIPPAVYGEWIHLSRCNLQRCVANNY